MIQTVQELTKTYHLLEDEDEPVLERAEGCTIDWKAGKNVTVGLHEMVFWRGKCGVGPPQIGLVGWARAAVLWRAHACSWVRVFWGPGAQGCFACRGRGRGAAATGLRCWLEGRQS